MKGAFSVLLAVLLTAGSALAGGGASPLGTVHRGDVCSSAGISYSGPFTLNRMTEMNLALTVEALQTRSEEASGFDVWSAECHVSSSVSFDFRNAKGGFDYTMNFQLRRGDRFGSPGTVVWEAQERGQGRNEDFEKVLNASMARLYARFAVAWRQSHP